MKNPTRKILAPAADRGNPSERGSRPGTLKYLSALGVAAATATLALLAVSAVAPSTSRAAKKGGGDPDHASEKTPSIITFQDRDGDRILSDAGTVLPLIGPGQDYEHGNNESPPNTDELRVFIGDAGGTGNIYMQFGPDHTFPALGHHHRGLMVDFSNYDPGFGAPDDACNLVQPTPSGPIDITPHFNNVKVNDSITNGVFGLEVGGPAVSTKMALRFYDPNSVNPDGDAYRLDFGAVTGNNPCAGDWPEVWVRRTAPDEWAVDIHADANDHVCLQKPKRTGGRKAAFCGVYHLPAQFTLTACAPEDNCPPAL